jgi:hypothetical protein
MFCERIDESSEKGPTLVNVSSQIALPVPRELGSDRQAEARITLQLVVSAFAGGFTGDCPVRFVWGGDAKIANKLLERSVLHFRWPDDDAAVTGKIPFHVLQPGLLTLDVYFGRRFMTRVRLKLSFIRAQREGSE